MTIAAGSLAWFIAHDARLSTRRLGDLLSNLTPAKRRLVLILAVIIVHAVAWPVASFIAAAEADADRKGLLLGGLIAVLGFATSWMLAQSLLSVTRSLYVRGDLDLMLSAPLPAGKVVAARMLGLAAENFGSSAVFLLPIAHALALQGHPHWLGLYPLVLALALITAAMGLAGALALFALIGPRRARTVAQILAMLIGAVVALGIQAIAVLPSDLRSALLGGLDMGALAVAGPFDHAIATVLHAARGDITAIVVLLAPAVALFGLAAGTLGPAFTSSVLRSAGADLTPHRSAGRHRQTRFRAEASASIRAKELKLLTRDPWVLGQLLLQMVYTLPVALILWRSGVGQENPAVAFTPSLVIIAAQLSGSLAWIAISGEDAPEFMATAPVTRAAVEMRKLEVIAMLVGGLLLVPLAVLTVSAPLAGCVALLFCAAASISCALINLWHPTDGRRRAFMRRHAQSKLIGLFEHTLLLLWAIGGAVAQIKPVLGLLPALVAGLVLWVAWRVLARRTPPAPARATFSAPAGAMPAASACIPATAQGVATSRG